MSRIARVTQKIFASSALNNGVFGSAQDNSGPGTISNDLAVIMGLPAWIDGWLEATIGASKFPPLEEMQSLQYVHSTQIAYCLQQGIPEYDAGTAYYIDNVCMKAGTLQLYASVANGNIGNALTDTANWALVFDFAVARGRLTGTTNYYVATTGNDSNAGTVGSPWLTLQHAINYVRDSIDLNGQAVIINVADGTYTGAVNISAAFTGGGSVTLKGNITTPANCIIHTTSTSCVIANNPGSNISIKGFKLTTTTSGDCLFATNGGVIQIVGLMDFGAAAAGSYHCYAAGAGAQIIILSNYNITGGADVHHYSTTGGDISNQSGGTTTTLTGTPAFTDFAIAQICGTINYGGNQTFSGSATGVRYLASANGVIATNGGGASFLPGNSAGSTATGGEYV